MDENKLNLIRVIFTNFIIAECLDTDFSCVYSIFLCDAALITVVQVDNPTEVVWLQLLDSLDKIRSCVSDTCTSITVSFCGR